MGTTVPETDKQLLAKYMCEGIIACNNDKLKAYLECRTKLCCAKLRPVGA
jgi:hypothetical protein